MILHDIVFIVAIQALKRKKRLEKQLQQNDAAINEMEMQREALEGANTNTAVLQQQDAARVISEANFNPVAFGQDIDEVSLIACISSCL